MNPSSEHPSVQVMYKVSSPTTDNTRSARSISTTMAEELAATRAALARAETLLQTALAREETLRKTANDALAREETLRQTAETSLQTANVALAREETLRQTLAREETLRKTANVALAREETLRQTANDALAREETLRAREETLRAREETLRKTAETSLQTANVALAREETLRAREETLRKTANVVSMSHVADKDLHLYNLTNSSAHLNTTYRPANIIEVPSLPQVTLPSGFWDAGVRYESDRGYSSEAHVTQFNVDLVRGIIAGLGFRDVQVVPQVQNMDVTPDLTLVFGKNRVCGLAWEDKKDNGGQATWNSGTAVAGQVFEQLMVTHIGLGGPAYGIYSTFNSVRLVSTVDFGASHVGIVSVPVMGAADDANAGETPDRLLPRYPYELRVTPTAVISFVGKPEEEAEQDGFKHTRVSKIIELIEIPRCFYASRVYDLANPDDADRREKNVAVIKLIATACLLAMQSVNAPRRDVNEIPFTGPARVFNLGKKLIYNTSVELAQGIRYDLLPTARHMIFYSFRQVGYGSNAVCCLATASNGAACALKIFREGGDAGRKLAAEEAQNWERIYGDQGWNFIRRANINDTHILVLPYFDVPCNKEERDALLEGREESLLWNALDCMAKKGYAHSDLKWHHVGSLRTLEKKRNSAGEEKREKRVFLFDLGDVRVLDPSERDKWVTESFKELKKRSGALNGCS